MLSYKISDNRVSKLRLKKRCRHSWMKKNYKITRCLEDLFVITEFHFFSRNKSNFPNYYLSFAKPHFGTFNDSLALMHQSCYQTTVFIVATQDSEQIYHPLKFTWAGVHVLPHLNPMMGYKFFPPMETVHFFGLQHAKKKAPHGGVWSEQTSCDNNMVMAICCSFSIFPLFPSCQKPFDSSSDVLRFIDPPKSHKVQNRVGRVLHQVVVNCNCDVHSKYPSEDREQRNVPRVQIFVGPFQYTPNTS